MEMFDKEGDELNPLIADSLNKKANPIVWLDIGGKIFKTYVNTLLRGGKDCLFVKDLENWDYSSSGNIELFYDRDGGHFMYILNYLRNKYFIPPPDHHILNLLLCEAIYYNLPELVMTILTVFQDLEQIRNQIDQNLLTGHLNKYFPSNKTKVILSTQTLDQKHLTFLGKQEEEIYETPILASQETVSTFYEESITPYSQQSNISERFSLINDDPPPPPTLINPPNLGPKIIDFDEFDF